MSQVHITDGQQNNILDYITAKHIISDNHKKSLENTLETYQFITFADKRFSEHLEKRNRIIIPDEDGTLVEFVIFEAIKYKDSEGYKAQVFANASYLELKKASILYPDNGYTGSASQHGGRALNGTGWQMGIVEGKGTRTLTIENHTNPYEMLKRMAREFGLELKFRVEHDGNKITGRYVDLLERVGMWRGREVEFGKDLDGIRRVEKQDIVTALLGLGPEDENGNSLEVLVEDNDALQRWGRLDEHGNLNHLIEPYDIQSERSEMTKTEARQYTRTALDKRIDTQVTYETTIIDLENVPGMQNKKIRFGDTIKIKDTKFNPPLYLEARVFEQTRSIKSNAKKEIKLGDYIEYTEEQVNAIWKQLQKQIQNRVSRYEMVEYTYDKLTVDVKDETVFTEGKTFAEATGITAENNAKEYALEQDGIVETNLRDYAEGVAYSALDQAKMYSVAQEIYDIQMQNIASDISDRAPLDYVDGRLVTVEGAIDDFNAELEEKADGSIVYTILEVDNMINNTVSKTQYTADMDGVVQDLNSYGTRIGQNETAIGFKADQSSLNTVEGTLSRQIGNVDIKADGIIQSVGSVETNIDDLGGRVSTAEGSISTLAGEVSLKANQSIVDSLEGRVETTESELSVLPGQIASKVDDGQARSIFTQEASSFTFSAGQINFDGHVFGGNATFTGHLQGATGTFSGSITSPMLEVGSDNITGYEEFGLRLQTAQWQASTSNPFVPTGQLIFNTLNDSLEIHREDRSGNYRPLQGFRVDALTFDVFARFQLGQSYWDTSSNGYEYIGRNAQTIRFRNESVELSTNLTQISSIIQSVNTTRNTGSSSANVRIGPSSGEFYMITSASRYKLLPEPLKTNPYRLLELVPKDWYDRPNIERMSERLNTRQGGIEATFDDVEDIRRVPGLIAEEVEAVGLENFVDYHENGEVVGLQYDRLWTLLIPITNDHEIKLNNHEIKLTKHEQEIFTLKDEVGTLKNEVAQLKGVA